MQRWSGCLLPQLVASTPSQVLTSAYPPHPQGRLVSMAPVLVFARTKKGFAVCVLAV